MKKILTLIMALAVLLGESHAAEKPNIIFILADDLGIGNVGCNGSDHYKSPHIDKLAATGTRFTQSFSGALKLRDDTLIIFMGDNGTGKGQNPLSTIGGRNLSGMKGSMLECGGLVPTIANWPGKVPSGKVSADLIDSTDFIPTFAELAGGKLPAGTIFDGHSFAPQLRGQSGPKCEWVFNQLAAMWHVRAAGWKLNEKGELFDMSGAPFTEKLVAASAETDASKAARARLTAVLAKLNSAVGIPDSGDGTGRHANKDREKKKKGDEPEKPATKPGPTTSPTAGQSGDAASVEPAAKFDKLDKGKTGKLTRESYTTHQSDPDAAAKRFGKVDADQDGLATREESISNGSKKAK